jgi:hypothetical protein
MQQKKEAYWLDEVAKHGKRLRTRQKIITTVRARIVTELKFRIGNERRESRRDYNRDCCRKDLVGDSQHRTERRGGRLDLIYGHQFFMLLGLYRPAAISLFIAVRWIFTARHVCQCSTL